MPMMSYHGKSLTHKKVEYETKWTKIVQNKLGGQIHKIEKLMEAKLQSSHVTI